MRALVLVLALAVLGAAAWEASARTQQQSALRLVDVAPVTFHGSAFRTDEVIRVVLTRQDRRFVRTTRANARGAFDVRFGLLAIDVCRGAITVSASGDRGSRATYRRACRPLNLRPPLRAG
jgi:hypothetical protein